MASGSPDPSRRARWAGLALSLVLLVTAAVAYALLRDGGGDTGGGRLPPPGDAAPTEPDAPREQQDDSRIADHLATSPVVPAAAATQRRSDASGDVADDPAIWVDVDDPARSVVIGTDKSESGGGIAVYDLTGARLQFRPDGMFNNVDLRSGMVVGGAESVVVTVSDRTEDGLAFYRFDPDSRRVEPIGAVSTGFEPYGLCMYRSARTGAFYAFVSERRGGTIEQYELDDADDDGQVDASKVRTLPVGSLSEGCVADDELGQLFVGEEEQGIWRYGAEPDDGSDRTAIGTVGDGRLVADVEGLALTAGPDGGGYLFASSQGDSTFAVYDRTTGEWVGSFDVDGADDTDGLDVVTSSLADVFPHGLLVVHDASGSGADSSTYKLVDLGLVLGTAG